MQGGRRTSKQSPYHDIPAAGAAVYLLPLGATPAVEAIKSKGSTWDWGKGLGLAVRVYLLPLGATPTVEAIKSKGSTWDWGKGLG